MSLREDQSTLAAWIRAPEGVEKALAEAPSPVEARARLERLVEGVEPGQSTEEVLANYLAYVAPALISRASHPVQFGVAAGGTMDLLNAGDLREWGDTVSIRYRSRRDFMEKKVDEYAK